MLDQILNEINNKDVQLVVVSKIRTVDEIKKIYDRGVRDFGENRVQELLSKYSLLPTDISWHLIGHLQTNKVKSIIDKVDLIHSIDSQHLLDEVNFQAGQFSRKVNCLLQLKVAKEESKFGLSFKDAIEIIELYKSKKWSNVEICGIMGMGTLTDDELLTQQEFSELKSYFDEMKTKFFPENEEFKILSMGMSGDYKIAIQCGSNMIRVGSLVFRN